ncbi:MAG: sulfite exporter TauE/SafE family protein [Burkholderiales bacterium]
MSRLARRLLPPCAGHALALVLLVLPVTSAFAAPGTIDAAPWWLWPLALFFVCFALGIVAVPAGVGGGVLFVPIVGGFFPFDLDFVRGAGLLVALASSLAATPNLLRTGLADVRLALPLALVASVGAVAGALIGLALPAAATQVALGVVILGIVALMAFSHHAEFPRPPVPRYWGTLGIAGSFRDRASNADVAWHVHRIPTGAAAFAVNGFLGGMFGVGAGWANVPTLNLLMGAPLKIAVGTSSLILSLASTSAIWTYVNAGAVLPIIVAPAMIGTMLGARIGAHLLTVLKATVIRRMVIVLLLVAGLRALAKGLGW